MNPFYKRAVVAGGTRGLGRHAGRGGGQPQPGSCTEQRGGRVGRAQPGAALGKDHHHAVAERRCLVSLLWRQYKTRGASNEGRRIATILLQAGQTVASPALLGGRGLLQGAQSQTAQARILLIAQPLLKQLRVQAHGDYRTRRVILEHYDALATAARGAPYVTPLDPPPADPRIAHPPRPPAPAPHL